MVRTLTDKPHGGIWYRSRREYPSTVSVLIQETAMPGPAETVYTVTGMTCSHCVASVTEEVSEVEGVEGIDVDLETGRVVVTGEGVDPAAVKAAVEEAGYEVAP